MEIVTPENMDIFEDVYEDAFIPDDFVISARWVGREKSPGVHRARWEVRRNAHGVEDHTHPLVVLVFDTRAFVVLLRFFAHCVLNVDFSRAPVFVSLRALEFMSAQFPPLILMCRALLVLCGCCLVTDVATTNTAITSTVGSGAAVSSYSRRVTTPWRSVVKMTRRTVRGHVRLEEIFNNNKNGGLKRTCLMIRRKSKTGGIKHTCQVVTLESRSGVSNGRHLLIRRKPQSNLCNFLLRCSS